MGWRVALAGVWLLAAAPPAAAAGTKALKIIQPLPRDLLGAEQATGLGLVVGEQAPPAFDALEREAADKRAHQATAAPGEDAAATPPFRDMLARVVGDELRDGQVTGRRPVRLALQLDTLKTADAGVAMLLGNADELTSIVAVRDAATGEQLGEFYVDMLNARRLLGLAMRGSGVREKLARASAGHVAVALIGRRSRDAPAPTVAAAPPATAARTKLIVYPVPADIMAKTPAQLGFAPSPGPARRPDDWRLVAAPAADHEVTRASMMEGGASLTNPLGTLLRQLAEARDHDARLDDGAPAATPTVRLD